MVLRGPVIPRTDRDRAFVTIHTLLLHLRPVKVPARTIRFTPTFGLGGSCSYSSRSWRLPAS
jgi:hypothetical protein